MAKTKPIGVRFDEEILALIQKEQNLSSPQRVLNYLMESYLKSNSLAPKQVDNIKPEQVVTKKKEVLESPKNRPNPPINLKGLDLAIWKSENWE